MLLTQQIKEVNTREEQVEVKTPYYAKNAGTTFMLCNDESIIELTDNQITKWLHHGLTSTHSERVNRILSGTEVTESEFMTAYDMALKKFESSMFPEAMKINE